MARLYSSALTASPTSTGCTAGSTTTRSSSTPSTSSPWMAMTYASCLCTFGRLTLPASLPDVLTASTSHPSSKARSARTCSAPPAT
jgi:hypothetical protein